MSFKKLVEFWTYATNPNRSFSKDFLKVASLSANGLILGEGGEGRVSITVRILGPVQTHKSEHNFFSVTLGTLLGHCRQWYYSRTVPGHGH